MNVAVRAAEALGLAGWLLESVPESFTSHVRFASRGDERRVLKVYFNTDKLEREISALTLLRDNPCVPRVIATCTDPPAMTMTRLPGAPIATLTGSLAFQVGAALARIQVPTTITHDWWTTFRDLVTKQLALCRTLPEIDWTDVEATLVDRLHHARPVEQRLAHFDFRLGNLLAVDNSLTGVIDFESSRAGAIDFDFARLSYDVWDVHPELAQPMLDGYASVRPLPPHLQHHLPLYRLYAPLSAIGWCLKHGDRGAFFEENLRRLRASL